MNETIFVIFLAGEGIGFIIGVAFRDYIIRNGLNYG